MADAFTSWLWKVKSEALSALLHHETAVSPFAESPTQTAYLDRRAVLEVPQDSRISITQVISSHSLASFCKIINVPQQVKILQLKDLREPRHLHLQERVMRALFSTVSAQESEAMASHLALLDEAFIVIVPEGFEGRLQLGFLLKDIAHFHALLLVGRDARVQATIDVRSEHAHATYVQETLLEEGAQATLLVRESAVAGNLFSIKRCFAGAHSTVRTLSASKAERTLITKNRTHVHGVGVRSESYAIFVADKDARLEQESSMAHEAPGAEAVTLTRGTAAGASVTLTRGGIRIEEDAPRTVSHYEGKVLLLSSHAKANVIPTLQILTNDVQAKHGAAVGHVSEEELFYLQSRGLPEEEAKRILVEGFFAPILVKCSVQERDAIAAFFR